MAASPDILIPDVIVLGAGVLGLSTAVELGRRGHAVQVIDPGVPSASSVAAGMIAPAYEALADRRTFEADRADLYRSARDLWPAFADGLDIPLYREGAEWRGQDAPAVAAALTDLGFAVSGATTPDDWRVDPDLALAAMSTARGVRRITGRAVSVEKDGEGWRVALEDGRACAAPAVVAATGAATGGRLPAELRALIDRVSPIRGQIGRVEETWVDHVVRGEAGYLAPTRGGTLIGATMETGRIELTPDAEAGEALARAVLAMIGVEPPTIDWRVGVRGATPDGLPMAGATALDGLFAALAPRRNGWLLGPLVGRVVADAVEGRAPGPWEAALDPGRFG